VLWRKSSTAKWQNGQLTNFQYLMVRLAHSERNGVTMSALGLMVVVSLVVVGRVVR
jgi:hypothetical protein